MSKGLSRRSDILGPVVVTMTVGCFSRGTVLLFLLLLAALGIGMTAAGENTPPTVVIHTPEEGAALGLTVTVSGNATDAEGFNLALYYLSYRSNS